MTGFSPRWLDLREPIDTRSRSVELVGALREQLAPLRRVKVLDLGAGSGANLRYLAPRLGGEQYWRLLDNDNTLLSLLPQRLRAWAHLRRLTVRENGQEMFVGGEDFQCHVQWQSIDFSTGLGEVEFDDTDLVTSSALLDLVSHGWLCMLGRHCHKARVAVYFALNYDGNIRFYPHSDADEQVRRLFNRHQRTDKGFGPALGPEAVTRTRSIFQPLGFALQSANSDWHIHPGEVALWMQLCRGWVQAATEVSPQSRLVLSSWHGARRRLMTCDNASIDVGHTDLLGWIPDGV